MSYQAWKHEPFYWAPTQKPGGGRILHKSSPSAPPAPDYAGAAKATADGNLEAAKYATEANRVNQVTPWGTLTWNKSTAPDGKESWTQTTSLPPELQAALDSQIKVQRNQSDLAQTMQGQVQDTMSKPFNAPDYATYMQGVPGVKTAFAGFDPSGAGKTNTDIKGALAGAGNVPIGNDYLKDVAGIGFFNPSGLSSAGGASAGHVGTDASKYLSGVPGINYDSRSYTNGAQPVNYDAPQFDANMQKKYTDAAYASSTRLLGDQWGQQNSDMDVKLRLQGLTPGTEAYNNAMGNALKSQDFTRAQLADTALITGSQVANQDYASMLAGYKARNEAQAQDFSQRLQNYGADLGAQNQGFGQGMAKANYAQTGENMNAVNGINAASVNVQAAQANNQAALGAFNANLAAQGQQYAQANQNYQNRLTSQDQAFRQGLAGFEAGNSAQQQSYNQALAGFGANQASQQASNAAQAQAYGQAQNSYQTAYQSALNNYTMPLNMMNAVLSGNQVQNPQFSGYYTQGQTAGPDYSGAASALGQWQSGIYAQQQAANSSMNGLLGSAAMAAATYF